MSDGWEVYTFYVLTEVKASTTRTARRLRN